MNDIPDWYWEKILSTFEENEEKSLEEEKEEKEKEEKEVNKKEAQKATRKRKRESKNNEKLMKLEKEQEQEDIIEKIKELSNNVWSILGPGYSENIYHNALETELRINNILYESERILPIFYKGFNVGNVRPDIVLVDQLVIELKAVLKVTEDAKIQTQSYSNVLNIPGILINFPSRYGELEIFEFPFE